MDSESKSGRRPKDLALTEEEQDIESDASSAVMYYDGAYISKSWDNIPDPHRSRLESFLDDDEHRPWLVAPVDKVTFAATEDSLISVPSAKDARNKKDLGHRFLISNIHDMEIQGFPAKRTVFTYQGARIEIKHDYLFWILVNRFPQLSTSVVVQPSEVLPAINAGRARRIRVGCLAETRREDTVFSSARVRLFDKYQYFLISG